MVLLLSGRIQSDPKSFRTIKADTFRVIRTGISALFTTGTTAPDMCSESPFIKRLPNETYHNVTSRTLIPAKWRKNSSTNRSKKTKLPNRPQTHLTFAGLIGRSCYVASVNRVGSETNNYPRYLFRRRLNPFVVRIPAVRPTSELRSLIIHFRPETSHRFGPNFWSATTPFPPQPRTQQSTPVPLVRLRGRKAIWFAAQ